MSVAAVVLAGALAGCNREAQVHRVELTNLAGAPVVARLYSVNSVGERGPLLSEATYIGVGAQQRLGPYPRRREGEGGVELEVFRRAAMGGVEGSPATVLVERGRRFVQIQPDGEGFAIVDVTE